jgi:hypothetical protein
VCSLLGLKADFGWWHRSERGQPLATAAAGWWRDTRASSQAPGTNSFLGKVAMNRQPIVALMGVLGTLALCMFPSSCETDQSPTSNIRGRSTASVSADSLASLPMTRVGLPPSARLFDTDDGALEQAIAATQGLAFVAFKSPLSVRTFEAAGRRAAVPAATTRQALWAAPGSMDGELSYGHRLLKGDGALVAQG